MKAVLAQLAPAPGRLERNVAAACAVVDAHADADLVILPELFLSGYQPRDAARSALTPEAPELAPLRRACAIARSSVIVGVPERLPGAVANAAFCFEPSGRVAGVIRKAHLFSHEREVFEPARELVPVELAGTCLGVMICFDLEFPETARTLCARGAQALVTLSANMDPFGPDHELFARARALENGVPHLYVNRVGDEAGLDFRGGSCAMDATGRVLARAGAGAHLVEVDLTLGGHPDLRLNYREQLRPALYGGERNHPGGLSRVG
jgi:predicted amidohydrolase